MFGRPISGRISSTEPVVPLPPLSVLLASEKERDCLIAFAAAEFAHVETLLFLVALNEWRREADTGRNRLASAQALYDEYLAPRAPHRILVALSDVQDQKLVRAIQGKGSLLGGASGATRKVSSLFDGVAAAAEQVLTSTLLVDYTPVWQREQRLDAARREIVTQIDFSLDSPPPLAVLLENPKSRAQLLHFSQSLFCEEGVIFYEEVRLRFEPEVDEARRLDVGRAIVARFVDPAAPDCLNLPHAERAALCEAYERGECASFADALATVEQQMKQNLYYQFIAHLRAVLPALKAAAATSGSTPAATQTTATTTSSSPTLSVSPPAQGPRRSPRPSIPLPPTPTPPPQQQLHPVHPVGPPPALRQMLDDPILVQGLLAFAARSYNQERVVFYLLVHHLRLETDETLMLQMARKLFDDYIADNGRRQVSLDGRRHRRLVEQWDALIAASPDGLPHGLDRTFFDAAQIEVERTLENDIYPRYCEWQAQKRTAAMAK